MTVLNYERTNPPQPGPAQFLPSAPFTPTACETSYTAGINETAIISGNVTLVTALSPGTVAFAPFYQENGVGMVYPVAKYATQTVAFGASATIEHQAVVDLTPGITYKFKTDVRSATTMPIGFAEVTCRAVVTIVKRP